MASLTIWGSVQAVLLAQPRAGGGGGRGSGLLLPRPGLSPCPPWAAVLSYFKALFASREEAKGTPFFKSQVLEGAWPRYQAGGHAGARGSA